MSVIQRIKEELASADEHAGIVSGHGYLNTLVKLLPQLIQEHEALLRFVEKLRRPYIVEDAEPSYVNFKWDERIALALQALDKELK